MSHLRLTLTFEMDTPFHSAGNLSSLMVDKSLARNAEGNFVIPATSVKGFLREKAEVLLRTWGRDTCLGPDPAGMCSGPTLCLVCRVFGNPRHASPLHFADVVLARDAEMEPQIRSGVGISRQRRAAYPQHLFFLETTQARLPVARTHCEGHFPDVQSALEAAALVALAARWGAAIGGGKSRGLGWLKECKVEATLDGQAIPQEKIRELWREWKEGQNVAQD
ncbi:MAG: RAMP superfamily CRISPR-associated protein [Anaerolineales bacterium]